MLKPDLNHAQRFLAILAGDEPVTFQTFDDAAIKDRDLSRILHGNVEDHAAVLSALNAQGAGVFVMVNHGDGLGRTAKNVTGIRALFVDLDGAPLEPVMATGVEPHITVQSSPGRYHAYWLVFDCALEQFTQLQAALAVKFSSDPKVTDLCRVMRLPGFWHRKAEPFQTCIIEKKYHAPFAVADLIERLELNTKPTAQSAGNTTPQGLTFNRKNAIAGFDQGNRDDGLFRYACSLRGSGVNKEEARVLVQASAANCQPPMPEPEATKCLESAWRYDSAPPAPDFAAPEPISAPEWSNARSTPDCIVMDYLFADVAVFVAAGGMGKTTLKLFEAVHIALGLPLYGMTVHKQGAVLIITAEDSREMLVARLREIAKAMELTDAQIAIVMQRVRISDVSGSGFKVTEVRGDVVTPSEGLDLIIEACQTIKPVLIVIDPAVSFGVGESRVNDAEQGLIEAARKLRRALNCCVQYIHHTGKVNARDGAVDQYAGRGGSAFADGARMVHVLQSLTSDKWRDETGTELGMGEIGLRLARPKMSYCPPVGDILIRRTGYRFDHVERVITSNQAKVEMAANQVWQLLTLELNLGRYHSKNTLESLDTGLKRGELRVALDLLLSALRIEIRKIPNAGQNGKREYLHPVASPSETANRSEKPLKNDEHLAIEKSIFASPPPLGISPAANRPPQVKPSFSYGSPNIDGEPTARSANLLNDLGKIEPLREDFTANAAPNPSHLRI